MLRQSFAFSYNAIKRKVFTFGKNENYNAKQNFLHCSKYLFILVGKKVFRKNVKIKKIMILIIFMMTLEYLARLL